MAAWALGELEQRAAVPPLVTALKERSALVRATAARALGELEDPAAVVPLTAALAGDGDVEVRRAAAWALGEIP
jgi:HEAT repeat protein